MTDKPNLSPLRNHHTSIQYMSVGRPSKKAFNDLDFI